MLKGFAQFSKQNRQKSTVQSYSGLNQSEDGHDYYLGTFAGTSIRHGVSYYTGGHRRWCDDKMPRS